MTFEQALTVELYDTLVAAYNTAPFKGGDEAIVIEFVGTATNDTRAIFFHKGDKQKYPGNIQDFRFKD
jgi:hypothetical protein